MKSKEKKEKKKEGVLFCVRMRMANWAWWLLLIILGPRLKRFFGLSRGQLDGSCRGRYKRNGTPAKIRRTTLLPTPNSFFGDLFPL